MGIHLKKEDVIVTENSHCIMVVGKLHDPFMSGSITLDPDVTYFGTITSGSLYFKTTYLNADIFIPIDRLQIFKRIITETIITKTTIHDMPL